MTCRSLFSLLLLAFTARAQQNAVIQTETRVVLVDAIVTGKKGAYVRDLTAKDFRVWEDNREQAVKSLSVEEGPAASQPHYLVLFFADTSMAAGDQVLARQAAASFIDANAGPNHLIAVVNYNGYLKVAHNFTDNAGRLKDALKSVESSGVASSAADSRQPLGSLRSASESGAQQTAVPVTTAAADLGSRNTLRYLGNLAQGLGVLPGRKIIVLLSGTLPTSSEQRSAATAAIEASNKAGVAIYPVDVRPVSIQDGPLDSPTPSDRRVTMPRGSRGLQGETEDSRINSPDLGAASQQLLSALANGTGGLFIHDSSDLLGGLQQIGEEQSAYYTLSYSPPESKEGSCHTLKVKVNRGGTTVRARANYCNSKPLDLLAGTSTGKDLENRAAGAESGDIAASIELPYFYVSRDVARVNLAMEIPPGALKFENQKGKLHAEIDLLGIAATSDGNVGARFSDALKFDADNQAQVEKLKAAPLHYEKEFKIGPGQYSFTMAFTSGGANFGKLEKPLSVDPWTGSELALSGLVLSRETHPAADLGLASSLIEDRTPLVTNGMQVVPSGSNRFMKSEPLFFYFEVYEPSSAPVQGRVRVLDRKTGEPKWDSGPVPLRLPHQGGTLPVNMLGPGVYHLEVTAGGSSDRPVKRVANFETK